MTKLFAILVVAAVSVAMLSMAWAGCDLSTGSLWAIQVSTPKGWNTAPVYFYSSQECEEYAKNNPPGNHAFEPNYYCLRIQPQHGDEPAYPRTNFPNHESTEIYKLRITTNGDLEQDSDIFATAEECEKEGAYLEYKGKIRDFTCIPGRGQRPGNRAGYTYWDQPDGTDRWVAEGEGFSREDCERELKQRESLHFRGAHCALTHPHGLLVTVYAPAVFSNSLALWKMLDSKTYPTEGDCRAALPADRDAVCIPLSGELPAPSGG